MNFLDFFKMDAPSARSTFLVRPMAAFVGYKILHGNTIRFLEKRGGA